MNIKICQGFMVKCISCFSSIRLLQYVAVSSGLMRRLDAFDTTQCFQLGVAQLHGSCCHRMEQNAIRTVEISLDLGNSSKCIFSD